MTISLQAARMGTRALRMLSFIVMRAARVDWEERGDVAIRPLYLHCPMRALFFVLLACKRRQPVLL